MNATEQPLVPRIYDVCKSDQLLHLRFIKPAPGAGIERLHTGNDGLPALAQMTSARLSLRANTIIPFHMHRQKEKVYHHEGGGTVEVIMRFGNSFRSFTLNGPKQTLPIPAGCPHAVICRETLPPEQKCDILVISSSQNPSDIVWEDDVEKLLLNEHLAGT